MPNGKKSGPKGSAPNVDTATSGDVAVLRESTNAELQALLTPIVLQWSGPNGRARKRLISLLETAKSDPEIAASPPTQGIVEVLLAILSDSDPGDSMAPFLLIDGHLPDGELGAKFRNGRKSTTVSPLRKAIRRVLTGSPNASADDVWRTLKAKPPKGMMFVESTRLGNYVETDGAADTGYRRFANIVSEERRTLGITE